MKIILASLLLIVIGTSSLIFTKPVYAASACNIIKSPDPLNPKPDQDVKLNLDTSQIGQYTISVNNQTTGEKTPVIVTLPSQSQISIGKFPAGSFVTFQVYRTLITGLELCSTVTPDFHVTTDGSGNSGGSTPDTKTGGAGIPCLGNTGVVTALGCISYDPQTFVSTILKWVLGFAGGVALLLMILGAFQMVTSSGNPDALKSGQEQFSAALIGLVFVLLSVTLLQIIGVDILQIPGLTR